MNEPNTVNEFIADISIAHKIVHGPAGGADSTVVTVGGSVRAIAKLQDDLLSNFNDALMIQEGVYPSEEIGRLAVTDAEAFKDQGSGDVAAFEYRRTTSANSVLISIYPSKAFIDRVSLDVDVIKFNVSQTLNIDVSGCMPPSGSSVTGASFRGRIHDTMVFNDALHKIQNAGQLAVLNAYISARYGLSA